MNRKLIPRSLSNQPYSSRSGVLLHAPSCKKNRIAVATMMVVVGLTCLSINRTAQQTRNLMSFRNGMLNAIKVKSWRHKVNAACKSAVSDEEMKNVFKMSREFTSPIHEKDSLDNLDLQPEFWIQQCPFVFLDLGTGVGDAIGEFIDSGLLGCRRSDDDTAGFDPMHFNVDSGRFLEVPGKRKGEKNEEFTHWVKKSIDNFYPGLGPEDYCVYGVEANPLLKDDLAKLERHVNRMEPRPLRHLHFLNEKAIHSVDGIKKTLYLDSIKNDEKYPGSSLFEEHKDIRESVQKYKDTFKYNVDTISLSSLMKQTLSYFHEDDDLVLSTDQGEDEEVEDSHKTMEALSKQHLIIYFDVEGSEFHVLNEAVDSGVLCDFVSGTNNVLDIFIEYHSPDIMNKESASARRYIDEIRPLLTSEKCGGDNLNLHERMKYFVESSENKEEDEE